MEQLMYENPFFLALASSVSKEEINALSSLIYANFVTDFQLYNGHISIHTNKEVIIYNIKFPTKIDYLSCLCVCSFSICPTLLFILETLTEYSPIGISQLNAF